MNIPEDQYKQIVELEDRLADLVHETCPDVTVDNMRKYFGPGGEILAEILMEE